MFPEENNVGLVTRMLTFETVVREGGFTAGARALGISKASVSKQVAALEQEMGVRLLHRTTRLVQPTEAGNLFYERCAEVVRLVSEARGLLSSIQEDVVGRLRVSIPVTFGRSFLRAPLMAFAARYDRVEVDIQMSDRPVDVIGDGYDVAIRVGPVMQPHLVTRKLCETRKVVVASPDLLRRCGPMTDPEGLRHQPCVLYSHQARPSRWSFQGARGVIHVPVNGRVRSNNGDLLLEAACAGLGFAWLPDFIVAEARSGGQLVTLFDEHCAERSAVQAVLPERKYMPPKVREMLRIVQAALEERAAQVP
jgi:DNA-binding transcriptional LysR family regulator